VGREEETFPVPHTENGSKASNWWFLSVVFILYELGKCTSEASYTLRYTVLFTSFNL
jgi:hypothetical protein